MSAYGCCGAYNDHAKDCIWNDNNPKSYENLERKLSVAKEALEKYAGPMGWRFGSAIAKSALKEIGE